MSLTQSRCEYYQHFSVCCMPLSWAAERHTAFGVVLQIDRAHHTLRVSCLEIPATWTHGDGFPVRNGKDLDGLQPGTLIDFTVSWRKAPPTRPPFVSINSRARIQTMAARQLNLLEVSSGQVPMRQRS